MIATTATPLYARIKASILEAAKTGQYMPGDRLPSEQELVERFAVSRMTVNRALRELKDQGVITRVAGVGSFLADPTANGHLIEVHNIADEIRERGHEHRARVISNVTEEAGHRTAGLLGISPGAKVFRSVIVHLEAGRPIQLEDRHVLASAAPAYGRQNFTKITPNQYLMQVAPLQGFDHEISAVPPDERLVELLALAKDEPCLLLVRRTWSADRIVSHAELYHPGFRFKLADSFRG